MKVNKFKMIKDHEYLLSKTQEVNQICKPLFENSFLTYFDCGYFNTKANTFWELNSNNCLIEKYITEKLYPDHDELSTPISNYNLLSPGLGIPVGGNRQKHETKIAIGQQKSIPHIFYIHQPKDDGVAYYGFGTSKKDISLLDDFVNNIDIFEKFIKYFTHTAQSLITQAKQHAIQLEMGRENNLPINKATKPESTILNRNELNNIFNQNLNKRNISLTRRQAEILKLIAEGYTYREIGGYLNLSSRTIEMHVDHLKTKTNFSSKSELRDFGKAYYQ